MTVAEQRAVAIPAARIISLSPDGNSLVAAKPATGYQHGQLCTYDVATLAERARADLSVLDAGLRIEDVDWSPDSSKIVFAEEAFLVLKDGAPWIRDDATGKLRDLTDDGVRGPLPLLNPANSPIKEFFIDVNALYLVTATPGGATASQVVSEVSAKCRRRVKKAATSPDAMATRPGPRSASVRSRISPASKPNQVGRARAIASQAEA